MSNILNSAALLAAGVCSLAFVSCKKSAEPSVQAPVRVEVCVLGSGGGTCATGQDVAGGRRFSGTVEAAESATLSFSAAGQVTDLAVEVGDRVSRGQVLGHVKSASLVNAHNIAKAELNEARDAYARLKKLHDADALPDVKWVEIQNKLSQAENAEAMAARAVSDATLTAPFSGYVSEKMVQAGQTVIPAQPVVAIVNPAKLQMVISVPEEEIASFAEGTPGTVIVDADSARATGKVSQKGVVADPLTRAYTVKFDLDSPGPRILPGMTGSVVVNTGAEPRPAAEGKSAAFSAVLPSQAVLLSADNRQFVWLVRGGRAERRFVAADELTPGGVNVTAGIAAGDSVIVAGMQKVGQGSPVCPITSNL